MPRIQTEWPFYGKELYNQAHWVAAKINMIREDWKNLIDAFEIKHCRFRICPFPSLPAGQDNFESKKEGAAALVGGALAPGFMTLRPGNFK
jgi:hypothetical protein